MKSSSCEYENRFRRDFETVIRELKESFAPEMDLQITNLVLWPDSVLERWRSLNRTKSSNELAVLSWNTNGRLNLRGCRESLLRRWSTKGFVDLGLVQEHFKKDGVPLFDLFGPTWWNLSSGAVGKSRGRKSGGCAIYGRPGLVSDHGFQHKGGRICGAFTAGGLVLSVYFPTKCSKLSIEVNERGQTTFCRF